MGVKSSAAGDSMQMGSLCHPLPIDDDDSDDSGVIYFFSLTFLCFFLIQNNAKFISFRFRYRYRFLGKITVCANKMRKFLAWYCSEKKCNK